MKTLTFTIDVAGHGMAAHSAWPGAQEPRAAVVVIQHAPGIDAFLHSIADRLAQAGYVAVAPDLYHRVDARQDGLAKMKLLKDRELEADLAATVDWLRGHSLVAGDRLGVTGFCMGGRVAYLAAAAIPAFKAAVAYYGGNIMVPWGEGAVAPIARSAQIHCPFLFHFGADDTNPSPEDMRKIDAELTRHGKLHEFHVYENAGHAFMNFTNAERYREAATNKSWPRTLEFLARHLSA